MVDVDVPGGVGGGENASLGGGHPSGGGASGCVEGSLGVKVQQADELGVACWALQLCYERCNNDCVERSGRALDEMRVWIVVYSVQSI